MAVIDSKKLLPPSKSSGSALATQKFLVPVSNIKVKSSAIVKASDITPEVKEGGDNKKTLLGEVIQIRKNVISIQKIIGDNNAIFKRVEEQKRKLLENEKFAKKEKQLETKDTKQKISLPTPSLPRTGFLDAIKRFLFFTLLGAAFVKFGKHIPKILEFSKKLIPAFKFLEEFTGNLLNGVVDFVGAGYKAYDKVKEVVKSVGGDNAEKKFDEFSKQFNTFTNLALIAGMSTMGGEDPFRDRRFNRRSRRGFDRTGRRVSQSAQARYASRYGKKNFLQRFGNKNIDSLGDAALRLKPQQSATQRFVQKGVTSIAGKRVGAVAGRLPIVGPLIDFGIRKFIFNEPLGKAAAGAVGAAVGQSIGTWIGGAGATALAASSFGLGALAAPALIAGGAFLGGLLGDLIGTSLYSAVSGGEKPVGKSKGGQVTRGGKKVSGPARRSIRAVRTRPPKIKPQRTIPGKDIGGKKQIEKLFPTTTDPRQKNPLGVLETTSKNLKEIPLLGGIMGASVDLTMGQKPDENTFKKIGTGFGYLIQSAIDAETTASVSNIQRQIVGLAGGGMIPRTLSTNENVGMKIGERIAKTLQTMVNSKVSNTLQAIRQQLNRQDIYGGGVVPGIDGGGAGGEGGESFRGGQFSGSAASIPPEGKALLDAIAGSESSGYNSRYPSKSFDNKWVDHPRISEVIRSGPNRGRTSDAAGRYQFLSSTWDQYKPAKAFTPENQDIAAYRLAIAAYGYGESGLINDLKTDPAKVARKLSRTWTSLPGGIEPNNATRGFETRFQNSLKKYKNASEPIKAKNVKKFSRSDITSFFRQQESFRKKPHEGMDLAAPQGTPISFGMGGEVIGVWRTNSGEKSANGGYGTYMDIKFSDGRIARIAHLSSVPANIKKGTKFRANQIIAYSGGEVGKPGSGRSGGPHIHLEQLSMPMGIEETTKGKYDPIKGGIFNLIQQGGKELSSIIPNQPPNAAVLVPQPKQDIASGIQQQTTYEVAGGFTVLIQPIEKRVLIPTPTGASGTPNIIHNNSTLPITASLYS